MLNPVYQGLQHPRKVWQPQNLNNHKTFDGYQDLVYNLHPVTKISTKNFILPVIKNPAEWPGNKVWSVKSESINFENSNVSTFIHAQIAPLIKLPIKQSHSNCNVQMGKWSHKKLLICHSVIWIVTSLPADLDLPYYLWVMLPSCSNAQGYRHKQSNLQIAASGNSCTELDFTSLAQLLVSFEKT